MTYLSERALGRWSAASRVLAGTLGAYGLTSLSTAFASFFLVRLGMDRVEAVVAVTLASFALFAVVAVAVLQARSVARAWLRLVQAALALGLCWLSLGALFP